MRLAKDSLRGHTALVTGAGSGIGRASAKMLAYAGARVALLGRSEGPLREVCDAIGSEAAGHLVLTADVRDEQTMRQAMASLLQSWDGQLDVVVANAGMNGVWAPLEDLSVNEWNETLDVNLRGTFLTVKLALPGLKKRGGSVIVISSVNGNRMFSNTGATAYACSKAAQVAFTKMTALELAKDGIRVNAICPGAIETNIDDATTKRDLDDIRLPVDFPEGEVPLTQGRSGTAGQVAQLVWFLASEASNHISGTEVYIDGAQSLIQG